MSGEQVFLSYSRVQAPLANEIARRLRATNISVWLDTSNLRGAVRWRDEISEAIRASVLFVALDSPEWQRSVECAKEKNAAEAVHLEITTVSALNSDQACADLITRNLQRLLADHPWEPARAEITVRSHRWRTRSNPGQLARRAALRRYRRVPADRLDQESRQYLRASRRRQRLLRSVSGIVVLLTVIASILARAVPKTSDQVNAQLQTDFDKLARENLFSSTTDLPYYVMSQYLSQDHPDVDGLALALSIPIPDHSSALDRQPLAIASTGPSSADIVDFQGRFGTESKLGTVPKGLSMTNLTAAAISPDGRHRLAIGRTTAVALTGSTVMNLDCPDQGTGGAIADDGSGVVITTTGVCAFDGTGRVSLTVQSGLVGTAVSVWQGGYAIGGLDGSVLVSRNQVVQRIPGGTGAGKVISLAATHDGERMAVVHANTGVVDIVATGTAKVIVRTSAIDYPGPAAWTTDGSVLAVAEGSEVALIDARAGGTFGELKGGRGKLRTITFDPDGSGLWALTTDGRAVHWEWRTGRRVDTGTTGYVTASTPWIGGFAYLSRDGRLREIDPRGAVVTANGAASSPAVVLQANHRGDTLAVADLTNHALLLWQGSLSTPPRRLALDCGPYSAAWSADDAAILVVCSGADKFRLVTVSSGQISKIEGADVPYATIGIARNDGTFLVYGNLGGVWSADPALHNFATLGSTNCAAQMRAVATDPATGATFAIGDGAGQSSGCINRTALAGTIQPWYEPEDTSQQGRAVAVDSKRGLVALGFADGAVLLIDESGHLRQMIRQMPSAVRALSFDAAGKLWVSGEDGEILTLTVCQWCSTAGGDRAQAKQRVEAATAMGVWS